MLEALKTATGDSESGILRRGLRLVREAVGSRPSARALAGSSVGKFKHGPRDLSTDRRHLDGFGK